MMDKSCYSSGESTNTTSSSSATNKDQYLKHLNKMSHKISKPPIRNPSFENHNHQPPPPQSESQPQNLQQHQPPVYNINKSDFRDVVQKLTGSPAHERFSTPPPIHPPKPQSTRLQRIRPPPLSQLSNRPPPLLNSAVHSQNPNLTNTIANASAAGATGGNFITGQRQVQPLSPLPPFPAVHAAAESPISAYMRYLQSSTTALDFDPKRFSGLSPLAPLISPRWNNLAQPQQPPLPPPQHNSLPSPTSASMAPLQFPMATSPLPFGCFPSPRSPYPLLSPNMLFSPNQLGFQQFPLSPTPPVPSPRWKGH